MIITLELSLTRLSIRTHNLDWLSYATKQAVNSLIPLKNNKFMDFDKMPFYVKFQTAQQEATTILDKHSKTINRPSQLSRSIYKIKRIYMCACA